MVKSWKLAGVFALSVVASFIVAAASLTVASIAGCVTTTADLAAGAQRLWPAAQAAATVFVEDSVANNDLTRDRADIVLDEIAAAGAAVQALADGKSAEALRLAWGPLAREMNALIDRRVKRGSLSPKQAAEIRLAFTIFEAAWQAMLPPTPPADATPPPG